MTATAAPAPAPENPNQEAERVRQSAEREKQRENLRKEQAIEDVFKAASASGLNFKVSPEKVISTVGTVRLNADGIPVTDGGKPLSEMLIATAKTNPMLVAETWQESFKPEDLIKSKADLKTVKDKSDYITQYGEMAFARLPLTAPEPFNVETLTIQQYRNLPNAVKSKLIERHGENFPDTLARADREQRRLDDLNGGAVKKKK